MKSTVAKIFGWAVFGLQFIGQLGQGSLPHGWAGWLGLAGAAATAVGIHASSNTNGQN